MVDWTGESRTTIAEAARRNGFGESASAAMAEALVQSGGSMAQFHHPELGGMGQWSRGGMLMIGDMFNDGLKVRVRSLADELSSALDRGALTFERNSVAGAFGRWWPEALGEPSSSGAQNGRRYAVFPNARRLAVETDGRVRLYDTGDHRLGGVSQQQGGTATLSFGSDRGMVGLGDFFEISGDAGTAAPSQARAPEPFAAPIAAFEKQAEPSPAERHDLHPPVDAPPSLPSAAPAASSGDPIALIQRLAELKSAGILSEEEFAAKKAELLARI